MTPSQRVLLIQWLRGVQLLLAATGISILLGVLLRLAVLACWVLLHPLPTAVQYAIAVAAALALLAVCPVLVYRLARWLGFGFFRWQSSR